MVSRHPRTELRTHVLVTGCCETMGMWYWTATQVGAPAEIHLVSEVDGFYMTECNISGYIVDYEKRMNKVVPRAGTEMDMGKILTHKRLAFYNYKKDIPTSGTLV